MHPFFRIMDIQMFEQIVAKNGLEWPKFSSFIRSYSTMLKELRDNLLQKTLKNGQKFYNYFILASVWSIQLIGVHLFLKIKKLWVNIVHENPKNEHFSTTKIQKKWPWMAKMSIFIYQIYISRPNKYPVHWDVLILQY